MNTVHWEIAGLAEENKRRKARKRNAAFRDKLREQRAKERQSAKLKLASALAVLAWACAAIRFFS